MNNLKSKKEKANLLKNSVEKILNKLSERQKDLLEMRFGLKKELPKSLDVIGKKMNITRERVRQIEVDGFKKIKLFLKDEEYNEIIREALEIVDFYGGFCEKRKLKEDLFGEDIDDFQRRQLMFLLNSSEKLFFQKANKAVNAFWYNDKSLDKEKLTQAIEELVKFIIEQKEPINFSQIFNFSLKLNYSKITQDEKGKRSLRMLLFFSKKLERNILEQWGARKWNLISGKGSREKAYLILKKYKEPLHFRTLTEKINQHWKHKRSLPQTVHNELIKDENFVQVGKGIYGLAEWGILKGTVKDIIIKLLEEKKIGVDKDEIVKYVLANRKVKKTTVMINLTDRNIFSKTSDGKFFLCEN